MARAGRLSASAPVSGAISEVSVPLTLAASTTMLIGTWNAADQGRRNSEKVLIGSELVATLESRQAPTTYQP